MRVLILVALCTLTTRPALGATPLTLRLAPTDVDAVAFPPGGRFTPAQFWAASVILPLAKGPERLAADFIASGEAAMLAWSPPVGANRIVALSDSHTLVRLLGGGASAVEVGDGDVVLRTYDGYLETQWPLFWSRLDPWVNSSGIAHPILVLDNVPYAFCDPAKCNANGSLTPGSRYGMDFGPRNVTEYGDWIATLLHGMIARYGETRASSFWFRVATEPNTRPGHWNDTNQKYADEYAAVAAAVVRVLPNAKVGLANMGADGSSSWDDDVVPMAHAIAASGARVDFIAMSCYGRASSGAYQQHNYTRYNIATAALCASRLQGMRSIGGDAWAHLPTQAMEYGLQQNLLDLVDDDPGVFGGAWQLATSIAHARGASVERAFMWHFGELGFAADEGACSRVKKNLTSKCSLYSGRAWVQAQAGHLFNKPGNGNGNGNGSSASAQLEGESAYPATVLRALHPGSNASTPSGGQQRGGAAVTSADGIGGWGDDADGVTTLRLLVTAFNPAAKTADAAPVHVVITFERPTPSWGERAQMKSAVLNRSTSTFDAIWADALANGWLRNASDPNVYPLTKAEPSMLTTAGRAELESTKGAEYLAMQRATFSASPWRGAADAIVCGAGGGTTCTVSLQMTPPSVVALWVRDQSPESGPL